MVVVVQVVQVDCSLEVPVDRVQVVLVDHCQEGHVGQVGQVGRVQEVLVGQWESRIVESHLIHCHCHLVVLGLVGHWGRQVVSHRRCLD